MDYFFLLLLFFNLRNMLTADAEQNYNIEATI